MQLLIMKHDLKNHYKGDIVEIRGTSTPFGEGPDERITLRELRKRSL